MSTPAGPPRRRHLIDPANPPPPPTSASLTRVQQWVVSVLAVTTILHLSIGLLFAAAAIDPEAVGSRVGLDIISGVIGVLAVAAGRAIHRLPPLSPWLLLGLVPGIVGLVLTLT